MTASLDVSLDESSGDAKLTVKGEDGREIGLTLSADRLLHLIEALGQARRTLVESESPPAIEGVKCTPVYRTNWALQIDALTEGSLFAFQHPAYGPIGLVFSPPDGEQLIKALQRHRAMVHSMPDAASRPS
ncbi:hypothetical protein [Acidomonas methanolica]|uniref:Uncharacterized protein n=1 Tax=Acidomonas methanolica NBRC 104435 TaxID=1231351 RepID=A0A023D6W7_ACIMT|nr:hypothetical protein [Acidomonas methanolica]MBU2654016.1 hypothetical protein [Acidomonas methanolica]MCQ9155423.1 hypothetical protein [Acidomonas methanolica]TCS30978.1 hypothetical protein EDC31_104174 [Acidomonas methanolica]GAJ29893.1 hypothetical protein Amme_085_021 [Acidomonas methanolica NBRC 104435]GBQ56216.1 hypothetical protein AA0498_2358 [Acidomonas methanolica]